MISLQEIADWHDRSGAALLKERRIYDAESVQAHNLTERGYWHRDAARTIREAIKAHD